VWLLLEVDRDRLEYPELKARVIALRRRWMADVVLIEKAMSGHALYSDLRQDCFSGRLAMPVNVFQPVVPVHDKETRFDAQTAKIQEGRVKFPAKADWLADFWQEFRAFPMGRYDDQVDSVSQFLNWMGSRRGESTAVQATNGGVHARPLRVCRQPTVIRHTLPRHRS
jgi:predicted phage terminase large subunit-like protein